LNPPQRPRFRLCATGIHIDMGKNKENTILNVWNAKKGGTKDYQIASRKYDAILAALESKEV
jgi:hypothetical protein